MFKYNVQLSCCFSFGKGQNETLVEPKVLCFWPKLFFLFLLRNQTRTIFFEWHPDQRINFRWLMIIHFQWTQTLAKGVSSKSTVFTVKHLNFDINYVIVYTVETKIIFNLACFILFLWSFLLHFCHLKYIYYWHE